MAVFWGVMGALVAGQLWAFATDRRRLEWVLKPAAALVFIAAGAWAGALASDYGRVLFAGLILAACGDVLLIPKDERAFLGGLVAFLLGHVAYAVAFVVRGVDLAWAGGGFAILVVAAAPVLRWLWPHVEPKMRGPVLAYVAVITVMVALAAGTYGAHGDVLVLVGAFAFYLSDLSVAQGRFVKQSLANRAWGLPLYFAAQLVLAGTVAPS
ncbi:MAG: lysoplasmalogenase [Sandaracinaceae bacterium]|nr:lysoplasmalogenase [Sandaracinaceae bacterium]